MITDAVVDRGSGTLYKCKCCDQTYIGNQKFRTTLSISISRVEYCKYVELFFLRGFIESAAAQPRVAGVQKLEEIRFRGAISTLQLDRSTSIILTK
jgi:hypothetical protein